MPYGVFLGRFQPFHIAHEAVVHEIMIDGLEPLILIGSPNKVDAKNPLTLVQRFAIIRTVFPDITIRTCDDSPCWDEWWERYVPEIAKHPDNVFYINEKPQDKQDFMFRGEVYTNSHYTDIYEELGVKTKRVQFPRWLRLEVNASDIRRDLEGHKHYLDGRNYEQLKEWKAFE
jgi:nicotinamide mononucleotide adenylyltransferase